MDTFIIYTVVAVVVGSTTLVAIGCSLFLLAALFRPMNTMHESILDYKGYILARRKNISGNDKDNG